MAERRMFTKTVIDSDAFLDMPLSSQALYFHLSMRADDDGFVNNQNKIVRMIGANPNDLDILVAKRFVLTFDSGVLVIKHWKMHNYIRKDRYQETVYKEELQQLEHNENNAYTLGQPTVNQQATNSQPTVNQRLPQVRLGKDRLGKDSIEIEYEVIEDKKSSRFTPPTLEEVKEYCIERLNKVDADKFIDHYKASGWMRGKTKIKDWKACVRTWEKNDDKGKVADF